MSRTTEEQFPALSARIPDAEARAHFTWPFLRASEVFDELVDSASAEVLRRAGAWPVAPGTEPAALVAARGWAPRSLPLVAFVHRKLAAAGHLVASGGGYAPSGTQPGDLAALEDELAAIDADSAVAGEAVRILVEEAGSFLSGEKTGEEILFRPDRLPLWFRYFSNRNLLYGVNNSLGALALSRVLPASGARVLEIGGGAGSAAEAALAHLGGRVSRYLFTEVVPTFARRGERAARAAAAPGVAVEAAKLDMTKPWAAQGAAPGAFDAVYSVNCFHVAPDLSAVLAEAREALAPGGALVVSECVRPLGNDQPIYVELVFDLLESFTRVTLDPVARPTHGFLTPAAWRESLRRAGFVDVTFLPDAEELARSYPSFFASAVTARKG
ncbi:MAG TPA: methyltransferase [Thermoanaerobaculia bacterium]|jgi:SAM-dependent methyltransferase|nr:methyltransferase [Thermoanaerobaculia bacterium]HPA51056.1 methyltransferase [Thermoanaerobaculia bacterium]HQN08208.1 methyltransferase [Thermoanaerobaculia bacterium]HQP86758.1 methyltransferase [Thermoanaerobaculia bacterium]